MAIIEVVVPELSESVSEASLIEWKKKVGDRVSADEVLIEIETDKIVMEVPAPESGVLVSIQQGNGASVTGGQLLATIDTSAAASAEVSAPKQAAPQQPAPIQHASAPQPTAPAAAAVAAAAETAAPSVKVMPSAAKMMANLGLNPADVVGSGKGGRITKEEFETHIRSLQLNLCKCRLPFCKASSLLSLLLCVRKSAFRCPDFVPELPSV